MSMIGNFVAISQEQLNHLIAYPDSIVDLIYADDGDPPNHIDIDKTWDGLHYLVTCRCWFIKTPWSNVILGGIPIGPEIGYGQARYLLPKQVQQIAKALTGLSREELAKRYDPKAMNAAKVYPELWGQGDVDLDYLLDNFDDLVLHYSSAAKNNHAMLLYID
jgi:Domain of unknown function (DUF1877)